MPENMFANLGRALRLLRELKRLSQTTVAKRAGIGKSQLSAYERGRELPKLDSLARVLTVLEAGYAELFSTLSFLDQRAAALSAGAPMAYAAPPPTPPGISPSLERALDQLAAAHSLLYRALWEAALAPHAGGLNDHG